MNEPADNSCWEKERKFVLTRLKEDDEDIKRIREEQIQTRIFVGVHNASVARTATLYGGTAGAVIGAIISGIIAIILHWSKQ